MGVTRGTGFGTGRAAFSVHPRGRLFVALRKGRADMGRRVWVRFSAVALFGQWVRLFIRLFTGGLTIEYYFFQQPVTHYRRCKVLCLPTRERQESCATHFARRAVRSPPEYHER